MERSWDDLTPTLRKRGRKSAASLSVVPVDVKLQRPEPPARLSAVEKQIRREIAEKVRPGWFWSSEPLLELYVQTLAHQRQLAGLSRKLRPVASNTSNSCAYSGALSCLPLILPAN
jgi:hypothetical protein